MTDDPKTFFLVSDQVRNNAVAAVWNAPADWSVTVAPRKRSSDQSAMFHAICSDIARSGHLFAGKPRKAEVWKVLLISAHAAATGEGNEVVPGLEGEFVNIRESSARMSVRRAASMASAPRDGTIIDIWRDDCGWVRDVWFDPAHAIYEGPDGWVTLCPRPFVGWRLAPYSYPARSA